jgi:hypothetical protein
MTVRFLPIVIGSFALLASCGSSAHQASPSAIRNTTATTETTTETTSEPATVPTVQQLPDPCNLITQQQAEAAIGAKLAAPVKVGREPNVSCTFTGPTTGPLAQVEVFVGAGAKKFLDIDKQLGHAFTSVVGIGDEATIENGAVFFRKGTTWIVLRLTSLEDPAALQPRMQALARQAAAGMS